MIPYQNCEIFASVVFFFIVKIACSITVGRRLSMYSKRKPTLTSIPERNENEEEITRKWVPKNKHEVLKAKYKCLKKLFQIYDASVIGILPAPCHSEEENTRRKKRSHRTKTDAYTGTSELSSGDVSRTEVDNDSVATAVIRDLKMTQYSSTHIESKSVIARSDKFATTSAEKMTIDKGCECRAQEPHPMPYLEASERRKPTRFQSFMQRLFGLRRDRSYKNYTMPDGHIYAASDNNIFNYGERRRRRGLRFRRLRRPKKIQSDGALDVKSPVILTYVQSIQRNCLMDTTPRHCPILGCRMISYGIINYNDHLNLCHFTDRRHICNYCHEGFETEYDKFLHENEHIGISKLTNVSSPSRQSQKRASDTQTDPELIKTDIPEDKLKKIVSFFDKIADPDKIVSEIKNIRYSESNLQTQQSKTETTDTSTGSDFDKRTISCVNLPKKVDKAKFGSSAHSDSTSNHPYESSVACHYCGEVFNYRRQLSLHVDLEHRIHDKFSKFHSCAGIINSRHENTKRTDMISEDGKINVQSTGKVSGLCCNTPSSISDGYSLSRVKSEESVSCGQSTNMEYTSLESLRKPSVVNSVLQKMRTINYKWEPGTKIVRV